MSKVFWIIFILLMLYTILPTILVRLFGLWMFKKKKSSSGIALTFDDGPDPEFTPILLDLLQKYQIKATFFVLGSKAEKYPHLILRIHQEGHLIGIHNYVHWANAFMTPNNVRRQLDYSVNVIENIIGIKPIFYRPPWGIINLFDLLLLKRFRLVLWSIMVGDWRSKGGKERIETQLLAKLKNNDVIVLHDSGQTFGADRNAPKYMLAALDDFLKICQHRGYLFLRIDTYMQLNHLAKQEPTRLLKRVLVYVWLKWEHLFHKLFNIHPIDVNNQIFYSRVRKYHGKTIHLANGEVISPGDKVVELHFNNEKLSQLIAESNTMVQLAVNMIRDVQRFLPQMTQYLHRHTEIKGIYGITMIHRGSKQLGFTVEELPKGLFNYFTLIYLRILLFVLHPNGRQRIDLKKGLLSPRIVAISVLELKRRYSADPELIAISEPVKQYQPQEA
ncbi:polysaccharide deacetylase family protein [Paenibacillus alba]|uniref:Polysaccharide deacetylase family protein n=1 Tax=Paenibacillus alba TaxID=1197127 RepID=A0ABU6GCW6_9BACL|nr:polysaccharide deacetylase family protein [Paenibacillus alba]MEC0231986.1 polysaccharide deacetylase family protein [Paenibacillus alba]